VFGFCFKFIVVDVDLLRCFSIYAFSVQWVLSRSICIKLCSVSVSVSVSVSGSGSGSGSGSVSVQILQFVHVMVRLCVVNKLTG